MKQQAELLAHSHIYILVHGAAMALYMFLPKHAAIIEVSHVCCHAHIVPHSLSIECFLVSRFITRMLHLLCYGMAMYQRSHALLGKCQHSLVTCCMFCCPMGLLTILRADLLLWRVNSTRVFALGVICCKKQLQIVTHLHMLVLYTSKARC